MYACVLRACTRVVTIQLLLLHTTNTNTRYVGILSGKNDLETVPNDVLNMYVYIHIFRNERETGRSKQILKTQHRPNSRGEHGDGHETLLRWYDIVVRQRLLYVLIKRNNGFFFLRNTSFFYIRASSDIYRTL